MMADGSAEDCRDGLSSRDRVRTILLALHQDREKSICRQLLMQDSRVLSFDEGSADMIVEVMPKIPK